MYSPYIKKIAWHTFVPRLFSVRISYCSAAQSIAMIQKIRFFVNLRRNKIFLKGNKNGLNDVKNFWFHNSKDHVYSKLKKIIISFRFQRLYLK